MTTIHEMANELRRQRGLSVDPISDLGETWDLLVMAIADLGTVLNRIEPQDDEAEETIKSALMQWGEAMQLTMENRSLFYSPVLKHWRVKKWAGKNARSFIYDGDNFEHAFQSFLGSHHGQDYPE